MATVLPNPVHRELSPAKGLTIFIVVMLFAELISMLIIHPLEHLPHVHQIILETAISTSIIIPLLYFFPFKPLLTQLRKTQQAETITQARLKLMQFSNNHTLDELLTYTADQVEKLTCSTIGFFHFMNVDQKTISLQAWSTNTQLNMCKAEGKGSHYDLEMAGVWADAIRQKKAIIHNDYSTLPGKKGLPEGHAQIVREMVVPIIRDDKVVAILGMGNKNSEYTAVDMEVASTFADFAWDIVKHIQSEIAISQSEEKFRTMVDWTYDWELWIDHDGKIVYTSPSCERISGYKAQEFVHDPELIYRIIHPDDIKLMDDHKETKSNPSGNPVIIHYRIIAKDNSEHWIEHICRPLYDKNNNPLGRRITNHDITLRKSIEKQVQEQKQKELELTQSIRTLQTDIGRDLHDTLGNQISFLRMNLEHLSEAEWIDPELIKNQVQNMTKAANESYEMIRAMLAILQTDQLDEPLSLFDHYARQVEDRSGFACNITSCGQPKPLSLKQIRQLYYIFREALGNIEKYANPHRVIGEFVWEDQALKLIITDDGIGFDPSAVETTGHYGLKFMRDRACKINGSLEIKSNPGKGTQITITVPYESEPVRVEG